MTILMDAKEEGGARAHLINGSGSLRTEKDDSMWIERRGLNGDADCSFGFATVVSNRNGLQIVGRRPLSHQGMSQEKEAEPESEAKHFGLVVGD